MPIRTKIRWTNASWNPVTGCSKVSPGCEHCYAERLAEQKRGTPAFPVGFDIQLRPHKLEDPLKWKQPMMVFVNSMSDLFHREIPDDYLCAVWDTMMQADWHTYQVLTKRPHRMAHKIKSLGLPLAPHIWLGTSVENQQFADSRVPALLSIPSAIRFLSCEPLLAPVTLRPWISNLSWCIVGGESGPGYRPMPHEWARAIRDECLEVGVAFYFKQSSAFRTEMGLELDGQRWEQYPNGAKAAHRNQSQNMAPQAALF